MASVQEVPNPFNQAYDKFDEARARFDEMQQRCIIMGDELSHMKETCQRLQIENDVQKAEMASLRTEREFYMRHAMALRNQLVTLGRVAMEAIRSADAETFSPETAGPQVDDGAAEMGRRFAPAEATAN